MAEGYTLRERTSPTSPHYSADEVWRNLLRQIDQEGNKVAPRGQLVRELLVHKTVVPMAKPVIRSPARKLSYRFLAGEAAWIMAGRDDVAGIAPLNKAIAEFSDDGLTFFGAYGPRVAGQINYVIETLIRDPDSRQAVMTLWRPNPPKSKDVPCTVALQFILRGGFLHCSATMRSSDAWLGWVYDVFNFSMIAAVIALHLRMNRVGALLGNLHLTAGSQHFYLRDVDKVRTVLAETDQGPDYAPFDFGEFDMQPHLVLDHLQRLALRALWRHEGKDPGAIATNQKFLTDLPAYAA